MGKEHDEILSFLKATTTIVESQIKENRSVEVRTQHKTPNFLLNFSIEKHDEKI